jgi:triphosphatase
MSDAQEYELKLEIEPENALRIKDHPAVAHSGSKIQTEALTSVYFDTEDLRLRDAGIFLRVRHIGDRYIQTIKESKGGNIFSRGEWEREINTPWPELDLTSEAALKQLPKRDLTGFLKPLFETRVQRTTSRFDRNGSIIELALDQGEIDTGERRFPLSELELELKDGNPRELFRLAHELSASVPIQLAVHSKSERGYALVVDGEPNAIEKAGQLNISAMTTTENAFKTIAKQCLRQVLANRPAMLSRNAEALHQMRIGLRRLRTANSVFKDVVGGSDREKVKTELKWITTELGPARDLDVLHAEVLPAIGEVLSRQNDLAEAARQEFQERRAQAYDKAAHAVKSPRFANAMLEAAEWIETGQWTIPDDPLLKLRREEPIGAHAAAELARRYKKIRRKGRHLRQRDSKQRHKLRIRAKKLRYAIEFFTCLVAGKKNERHQDAALSSLKELQSALGSLNDVATRETLMADIATKEQSRSRVSFVAGTIYASEDARTGKLLKNAAKAHKEFSKVKPFWNTAEFSADQPLNLRSFGRTPAGSAS